MFAVGGAFLTVGGIAVDENSSSPLSRLNLPRWRSCMMRVAISAGNKGARSEGRQVRARVERRVATRRSAARLALKTACFDAICGHALAGRNGEVSIVAQRRAFEQFRRFVSGHGLWSERPMAYKAF